MTLEELHSQVGDVCKKNFGIAVSFDILRLSLQREIIKLADTAALSGLPTTFRGLEASVNIDSEEVNIWPILGGEIFEVEAKFEVTIHLPSKIDEWLGKYQLSFQSAGARLLEDRQIDGQLGFIVESRGDYSMNRDARPKQFDARLIDQGIIDGNGNANVALYDQFEELAFSRSSSGPEEYLNALLSLIRFPAIRESLRAIKLVSPLQIDSTHTHIIVHSPNVEFDDPVCPRVPFSKSEVAIKLLTEADGTKTTEVHINESAAPSANSIVSTNTEPAVGEKDYFTEAFLYYYPEKVLLDWSLGALKPAVAMSDRDRKLGVYWRYNINAALKSLRVSFKVINSTKGEIVIEAPVEVHGSSSAGIKIGCVRHEVIGVKCDGNVDPLRITVEAGISGSRGDLYINGEIKNSKDIKPDIDWSTNYGFPFDQVADWILDRILDKEVGKIVEREVSLYRRNISLLSDVLPGTGLYLSSVSSNAANSSSILYAVNTSRD